MEDSICYPPIGYHIDISSIPLAISRKATCIQIAFSDLSTFVCEPPMTEKMIDLIMSYSLKIFVHAKYVLNPARKDFKSDALIPEVIEANRLKADIVIHQGKSLLLNLNEAKKNYISNLKNVLKLTDDLKCTNKILLENSAHQGTEMGYDLDELAEIFKKIDHPRLGICLDTCHAHVAGAMDLNDAHSVRTWMEQFDILIGLNHLKLIHFNGSAVKYRGCNDHHHNLLLGEIMKSDGYRVICKSALKWQIPMILETPDGMQIHEIQLIKSFIKGNTTFEKLYTEKYCNRM